MRLLFLDDSCQKQRLFAGLGGFAIDATAAIHLREDFTDLKARCGLYPWTEVKWSPPPSSPFRSRLNVSRHAFFLECIKLLKKYDATVFTAVHALRDCYGMQVHGWTKDAALLWGAKQQFRFIAERFERPYLSSNNDIGLVICDKYGSAEGENKLLQSFSWDLLAGTDFAKLTRIITPPLPANSEHCAFIQLADVLIGIVVGSLAGSKYALMLFDDVAQMMLPNPHEGSFGFSSLPSAAIIGFGMKVMPRNLSLRAKEIFSELDRTMILTDRGWRLRSRAP